MKYFLGVILVFLSAKSFAVSCSEKHMYLIDDKKRTFCFDQSTHSLFSEKCSDQNCKAFKLVKTTNFSKLKLSSEELSGGKNPATLLCTKMGGRLIPVKSEVGHHSYFCEFEDKSMISCKSLYYHYENANN